MNRINERLRGGFDRIDWNQGLKQNFGEVMKTLDLSSETPRRGSMQKPTDYISEFKLDSAHHVGQVTISLGK